MIVTIKAQLKSEEDAAAFNAMSKWCVGRGVRVAVVQAGPSIDINLSGDQQVLFRLSKYLEARSAFYG